ncbi:expressed unknown protein [Seminavis robusta]|uniref:Uncharacterized protein n=1 Tax=Seminavis robusta TaxID=568900 RepID=A0A9N8EI09_9STRA|nr:expressed unknown protein [Seminavis robusta]|eukprot:Sro1254_g256401.1  (1026) ;mRNA; r:10794-13871
MMYRCLLLVSNLFLFWSGSLLVHDRENRCSFKQVGFAHASVGYMDGGLDTNNVRRSRELVGPVFETLAWKSFQAVCQDKLYTIATYADTHIYHVITPMPTTADDANNDEDAAGFCNEKLVLHDGGETGRTIIVEEAGYQSGRDQDEDDVFHFQGSFSLKAILQAFHMANTLMQDNPQESIKNSYDVLYNNCATFILSFMDALGLEPDQSFARYIAERLAQNGGHTIEMLQDSQEFQALLPPEMTTTLKNDEMRNKDEEKELLQLLVDYYIQNRVKVEPSVLESEEATSTPDTSTQAIAGRHITYPRSLRRYLQASSQAQGSSVCSLCYGGSSRNNPNGTALSAWVDGVGYTTCEDAEVLSKDFLDGSTSCTISQISGVAHCGCPDLPPINPGIGCNFCGNDNPSYAIDFHKKMPQFLDPESNSEEFLCFDTIIAAQNYPSSNCEGLLSAGSQYWCGCPNATKPPATCNLCLDGAPIPDPSLEVLPGGTTCQDVIDLMEAGFSDNCGAMQATTGVYCGCDANIKQVVGDVGTYDLKFRDTPCRICMNRALLPDSSSVIVLNYRNNDVQRRLDTSCGEIEYFANAYDMCDEPNTFSHAPFCGCFAEDEGPDCHLCWGNETVVNETDALFPDLPSTFAETCESVQASLPLFPNLHHGTPRCTQLQELGFLACGCPEAPPNRSNTFQCPLPCSYDQIDPFRLDFTFQPDYKTCGEIVASANHAKSQEECDEFSKRIQFCCEGTPYTNGCSLCDGGSDPQVQGYDSDDSPVTCQDYHTFLPQLVLADDSKECTRWQDIGYFSCGCPSQPAPLPHQTECHVLPESCSPFDLDYYCKDALSIIGRVENASECPYVQQFFDLLCCGDLDAREIVVPSNIDGNGTVVTVTVQIVFDEFSSDVAWSILDSEGERVAASPVFLTPDDYKVDFDLAAGDYAFVILDVSGDGILGGSFLVLVGEQVLVEDAPEEYYQAINFTVSAKSDEAVGQADDPASTTNATSGPQEDEVKSPAVALIGSQLFMAMMVTVSVIWIN